MLKYSILTFLFISTISATLAQCTIDPFIEENHLRDAQILALRDILADPNDPDYHEGFIPEDRIEPYLEKLSAIYQNPNQVPFIDSLFNEFNFRANAYYNYFTPFKSMFLEVSKNVEWFGVFEATNTSGVPALDSLMTTFEFNKFPFMSSSNSKVYVLESEKDFINIRGLLQEFSAIEGVLTAETTPAEGGEEDYYQGIPYFISGEYGVSGWAELCDITYQDNMFTFTLYGGDCMAGCMVSISWQVEVSEDCQEVTLSADQLEEKEKMMLFPSPATNFIQLENIPPGITQVHLYTTQGKQVRSFNIDSSAKIDISDLSAGLYFLKLSNANQNSQTIKFIKN